MSTRYSLRHIQVNRQLQQIIEVIPTGAATATARSAGLARSHGRASSSPAGGGLALLHWHEPSESRGWTSDHVGREGESVDDKSEKSDASHCAGEEL